MIGVDPQPAKVDFINQGRPTIVEQDIDALMAEQHRLGRVRATHDTAEAIHQSDVTFICVGTPPTPNGHLDLTAIRHVATQIGKALATKPTRHVIALRSTVLPGTGQLVSELIASASGKSAGEHFAVVSNPEFLREGTSIADFENPPFTLVGGNHPWATEMMKEVYSSLQAPFIAADPRVAELMKYVCNSFHALKITFANEVGNVCKKLGIDSHELMEIFCKDTKLNISKAYLKPGFAYGGSCLPKDLRAILGYGRQQELDLPMLNSIDESNWQQIEQGFRLIAERQRRKIGMVGLSFKSSTDDLRESPLVLLAQMLVEQGYELRIFDPNVVVAELLGENKTYVEKRLPTADKLVTTDLAEMLTWAECLVIGNRLPAAQTALAQARPDQCVIDLVRAEQNIDTRAEYHGLGWVARPAN